MLSYRHGFHAGNSADVLKHLILCAVISYIRKKDKPFTIIDTWLRKPVRRRMALLS